MAKVTVSISGDDENGYVGKCKSLSVEGNSVSEVLARLGEEYEAAFESADSFAEQDEEIETRQSHRGSFDSYDGEDD